MPRPRAPPTPTRSSDLTGVDQYQLQSEMESSFALPPPALHSNTQNVSSKSNNNHISITPQNTPPILPQDSSSSSPRRKRTLSGSAKAKEDTMSTNYALPPPPSRARKIIQMKPKATTNNPVASGNTSASTSSNAKPTSTNTTASKRKQPSATSAAGRKIARKTAHSIIERRRRSKMNEEFGVLKDMIPACEGVEMHKLAILQAGIEYVRYLEGCVAQLKDGKSKTMVKIESNPVVDEFDSDANEKMETSNEGESRHRLSQSIGNDYRENRKPSFASQSNSSQPSPNILPIPSSSSSNRQRTGLPGVASLHNSPAGFSIPSISATPTPTLLSPAFHAIHFSPELSRMGTHSTAATSLSNGGSSGKPSPNILPLPLSALPLTREYNNSPTVSEKGAEATATAALMMLTTDRRGAGQDSNTSNPSSYSRAKGMSVKDLLTS